MPYPMITRFSTSAPDRLHDGGGAVSDYFRHRVPDFRRVILHPDHGVGTHRGCVLDHAVDRVPARIFQQFGVFRDLTAAKRAQTGHDVATQPATTDHQAEHLAL